MSRLSAADRRELAEYEKIALSDGDLLRLLDGQANIVLYPELKDMASLDEAMGPYGAAIILYMSQPSYGHWCAVFRQEYDLVEFFDPYSSKPDDNLDKLDEAWAAESDQDMPYLSRLMLMSPYRLSFNQYPFQAHKKDVRTCGRHCAARLLLRDLPLDVYAHAIDAAAERSGTTPDAVVVALTSEIAPKPKSILLPERSRKSPGRARPGRARRARK